MVIHGLVSPSPLFHFRTFFIIPPSQINLTSIDTHCLLLPRSSPWQPLIFLGSPIQDISYKCMDVVFTSLPCVFNSGIPGSCVNVTFHPGRNYHAVSAKWSYHFATDAGNVFLYVLANACYCLSSVTAILMGARWYLCWSGSAFPQWPMMPNDFPWASFVRLLWKNVIQVFCPFWKSGHCSIYFWGASSAHR